MTVKTTAEIIVGIVLISLSAVAQTNDLNPKDPALRVRTLAALQALGDSSLEEYTIGDGDEIEIDVVNRTELSGHHLVGPDGRITLPLVKSFLIKGLSREAAAKEITSTLERYYTHIDITVRVTKYGSNRILVLGNVTKPGVQNFDVPPTVLEALTKAGIAKSKEGDNSIPRRCAIFRGKDLLAWVELRAMLDQGESLSEFKLKRDDILYVPDDQSDVVSVLGEVQHPGLVKLTPTATVFEILAGAGGLTPDSGAAKIQVFRQGRPFREIPFHDLVGWVSGPRPELPLLAGDVIYVQKGGVAKFEYTLQKLSPLATMMLFGSMIGQ